MHKLFFFDDGRIRIRKAQKLTDPTSVADPNHTDADPDPAFHFDADPDPTFPFDADPDPTFQFDADPDPTTHFFPELDPPMLQNDPLRLPHFPFDADPDPAFHFDADTSSQNDADPDPEHWILRIRNITLQTFLGNSACAQHLKSTLCCFFTILLNNFYCFLIVKV